MLNLFKFIYIFILIFGSKHLIRVEAQNIGTCIALPDNKVAIVNGNQAWEYIVTNDYIQKYPNNGPKPVEETEDGLPASLTGVLEVDEGKFYLFRNNRFCIRKIEADKGMIPVYEEEEDIQIFITDAKGNKKTKNIGNFDGIETIVEEKSKCVWKSNGRLFACFLNKDKRLVDLCKHPTIIGALGYKNQIYLVTPDRVYQFDGKFNALYPLGKLVSNEVQLNKIWKGFDLKKSQYFTLEDQLFIIEDNKVFSRYSNKGKLLIKKNPIEVVDDMVNVNGAPIVLPGNRIAIVSGNQAFYYEKKDGNLFKDGKTNRMDVELCPESFPPKITGSFTMDMVKYLFFRGSKYCERKLTLNSKEMAAKKSVKSENQQTFKIGEEGAKMIDESGDKMVAVYKSSGRTKGDSSMCEWKETKSLFRCKNANKRLKEFCDKPIVYAIIMNNTEVNVVGEESTFVFKSKSSSYFSEFLYKKPNKGTGFNPKHNGIVVIDQEVITVLANSTVQKWSVESLQTPKPERIVSEETHKKMTQRLTTTTPRPDLDVKISEKLLNRGTVAVLPFKRIAVIIQDMVWYYKLVSEESISQSISYESSINVKDTAENFPPFITAAFTSNQVIYYFFRDDKYCKRPLIVDKEHEIEGGLVEWEEVYQVDAKTRKQTLVNRSDQMKYFKISSKDSHCIWRPNTELFGCNKKEFMSKYKELCDRPSIIGTVLENDIISVFTLKNVFKFQFTRQNTSDTLNFELIDKHFSTFLSMESLSSKKYKGFDIKSYPCFATTKDMNLLAVDVVKNQFKIWTKIDMSGKTVTILAPEPEEPEEPEELNTASALIPKDLTDLNNCEFKLVMKDLVYKIVFNVNNKFVIKEKYKINTNGNHIVAAIKSNNENWYFINTKGKYCKTTDSDFIKCREWHSNERLFGCRSAEILIPELKKLCDNPRIASAVNYGRYIYVFRNGKYWQFNNLYKQTKPFGDLVDGPKLAKKRWPNIAFPCAMGNFKDSLVTFKDKVYNQWTESVKHEVVDIKLTEDIEEYPDEPEGLDSEGGSLIYISENMFAKVIKLKVCYVSIKNMKVHWSSNCVSVKEDSMNFPKDIVAAISIKKLIYFITKDGKYCKREADITKPCKKFKDITELYGCSTSKGKGALDNICSKPKITAGVRCGQKIFVFRDGKYWEFDGQSTDDKPFGDLIKGGKPAKKRWKKIRFPAGLACDENGLIAIYGNSWSRWKIDTISVEENEIESTSVEMKDNLDKLQEPDVCEQPIDEEQPEDELEDCNAGTVDQITPTQTTGDKVTEETDTKNNNNNGGPESPDSDNTNAITGEEEVLSMTKETPTDTETIAQPGSDDINLSNEDEVEAITKVDIEREETVDQKKTFTTKRPEIKTIAPPKRPIKGYADLMKGSQFRYEFESTSVYKYDSIEITEEISDSDEWLPNNNKIKTTGNGGDSGGMYCVATTFIKARGGFTCKYTLKDNTLKVKQKCVPNDEEWHRFPKNLMAIIITTDKNWYLFNNKAKFCKRADKDYDECKVWLNNREAFGCNSKNIEPDLRSLCDNVDINAGGNLKKSVIVFRGGKYWEFDGRPAEGKPLGALLSGGKVARDRWPGIKFPGAVCHRKDNLVMIYDKKFSEWPEKGKPDKIEHPIKEKEKTWGTAIPLNNNKIGVVIEEKVWYYKQTTNKIVWESSKTEPIRVEDSLEQFPKNIDASFSFNYQVYYFFRGTEYCKRPLIVNQQTYDDLTYGDWVQSYDRPNKLYKTKVPNSEKEKYFTIAKKDGHCIWRDTYELLDCKNKKVRSEYMSLCSHPTTVGTIIIDKTDLYFFTTDMVYIMNGRINSETHLNTDSLFSNIRTVTIITELYSKWQKFELIGNHIFTNKGQLCQIKDKKKYVCWDKEGKPKGEDIGQAIVEPVDRPPNGETNPSAIEFEYGEYILIKGVKIKEITITDTKIETIFKDKPLEKTDTKTVAIIKTSDDIYYNIKNDGKFCKYLDLKKKKCEELLDNRKLFGCDADYVSPDLKSLCDKPNVYSGVVYQEFIYVFRGGKYWKFDNKPKSKQPFGCLVEGPIVATETFPNIKLPAAMAQIRDNLFTIVETVYNEWTFEGKHIVINKNIVEKKIETPDEPDGKPEDAGALICLENNVWIKIKDNQVCYYILKKDRLYRDNKCYPVNEDDNQFPPNIVAAIKTANDIWYYFNKEGKHCKRPEGDHSLCKIWSNNKELFADSGSDKLSAELEFLLNKPKITAGFSVTDAIYLFRGGKYWLFDNKPKPNKPFGELVEGSKPAKSKWPNIHFPAGICDMNDAINVVYKNEWISYSKSDTKAINIQEEPIREEELPDEPPKNMLDCGAIINPDEGDDTYKKIKGDRVCRYIIKNQKCSQKGRCIKVTEGKNNYPANIVAAIKSSDKIWYFINKNGMYCKRNVGSKETCNKWKPNSEIFGCSAKLNLQLEPLCDNTTIDSGGNIDKGNEIIVFRGGKFWLFDNKPVAGKSMGTLKTGGIPATKKWHDIHLPAGIGFNGDKLVAFFDETCRQWSSIEPITQELPFEFEYRCPPTAVLLANQRFVIVDNNKSYYFRRKGNKIIKDSKNNGPHQLNKMVENIPPNICAAFTDDNQIYYFFRYNKYCKRPLYLEGDMSFLKDVAKKDDKRPSNPIGVDIYLDDWYGNSTGSQSRKMTEAEKKAFFDGTLFSDSFCIWRPTQELLADCQKKPIPAEMEDLCVNPFPIGVIKLKDKIHFIREDKTFVFDQNNLNKPKNVDNRFSNPVKSKVDLKDMNKGFKPTDGQFLTFDNDLYGFDYVKKTFKYWKDGQVVTGDIKEAEKEPADEKDTGKPEDAGALIIVDQRNDVYKKVTGKEVCTLSIEDSKLYFNGKCVPVTQDKDNYPEDIIAAIVNRNTEIYFIRPNGTYCKRAEKSTEKCTDWRNVVELFGCTVTKNPQPEMKSLCDMPEIKAGGNLQQTIYVFRGGKYWQFDNKPQPNKPFGNLLDSAETAKNKWKGIHFPGAFGFYLENTIMIYKTRYSTWSSDGLPKQKDKDRPIDTKVFELPDEPEFKPEDRGALIVIDEEKNIFAKILGNKICYLKIVDNRMLWIGKCHKVDEDENNFPGDIVAVITTSKGISYLFDKNGLYCKRPKKSVEKCKEWKPNNDVFGCTASDDRSSKRGQAGLTQQELKYLCKNTKINAGGNYGSYIHIFKGGKYWKFDNKPKKDKPFGELVIGQLVAKDKWPGIHFPAGISQMKTADKRSVCVAVYKDKASIWPPDGEQYDFNIAPEVNEELLDMQRTTEKPGTKTDESPGERVPAINIDQPIENEEPPDEPDGHPEDMGALFNDDEDHNIKTQVKWGQVCNLVNRGNKLYRIGKCVPIEEDRYTYPPDIVAAIKNKNRIWYFISNDGKYCKRKDKTYEKCKEWKDNRELFGCNVKPIDMALESLCDNPKISVGGNTVTTIVVFRGGKKWEFNNKPEPNKPFGNLVDGAKLGRKTYPGIKFPGGFGTNHKKVIMVYNNTWSQWLPNNEPDLTIEPILDMDDSPGVAILLPFNRIAVVVKEEAVYYQIKGKNIIRDTEDTLPIRVEKTVENFPPDLSAVFTLNKIIYYFFRGTMYCKRPLIIESNTLQQTTRLDWSGKPLRGYPNKATMYLSEEEASKYFTDNPKNSYCIWRDNRELFNCDSPKVNNAIRKLCSSAITIGTVLWNNMIYVFTHTKLFVFDLKERGDSLDFSHLVTDSINPSDRWKGFDQNYGRFFVENNLLCVIFEGHDYKCWDISGKLVVDKRPIGEPDVEIPDEIPGDDSDSGALINPVDNNGKFTRIHDKKVCNMTIEDEDMYFLGPCVDVKADSRNFPPDIVAVIKSKDKNLYFLNKRGKYCKRPQASNQECKIWRDNKEPFGCNSKLISPQLNQLCKNVVINAGGNYPPFILVFRGGKLFKFNNQPKHNKPFGDLVEGCYLAKNKYPGILTPGAIGYNEKKLIMVYKKQWSQWLSNGITDLLDKQIMEKEMEIPDQPDFNPEDIGALITINDKEFAKIKKNKVCYVVIRKNKLFWKDSDRKCVAVSEDSNNFPSDIVAAIKTKDNNWYFIRNDGKYCKRPDKSKVDCIKWQNNKELFGCSVNKKPSKGSQHLYQVLEFLCKNPKINAGTNFPPFILVFRGGKYWKFDNKPEPNKPFGSLVEGQVPARLDFPGIHLPGGASLQKPDMFVMVYNEKWSRWKINRAPGEGSPDEEPDGTDEDENGPNGKPIKVKPGKKPSDDSDVSDDFIRDEDDLLDGLDGREEDAGALILIDETIGKYAKIVADKVCYIIVKKDRTLFSGECIPVNEDEHNYPPNIVAAIKNADNDWFYINKDGQYCQRKHNNFQKCNVWNDNRDMFGCNTKGVNHKLQLLCANTKIKAGTQEAVPYHGEKPRIWIFRGGKFWVFDNKVENKKPLGKLIDGAKLAGDLWDGIHFPGGAGFDGSSFIMIYKKKWSRWTPADVNETLEGNADEDWLSNYKKKTPLLYPNGEHNADDDEEGPGNSSETKSSNKQKGGKKPVHSTKPPNKGGKQDTIDTQRPRDVYEQKITDEIDELEKYKVGTDGESALITTNIKRNKVSKVIGNLVCHYFIRDNKCYQRGNCTEVSVDRNNFPTHIVAAIKAKDKYMYFIATTGKYCKRHINNVAEECTKWLSTDQIYGCDTTRVKVNPIFSYLCRNSKINAGANYPPYIYLFKDGMFWKFDNKYTPKRPFGEMIEGAIPARNKWPLIHFPGAALFLKKYFIIIYKNKWSRWRPEPGSTQENIKGVDSDSDNDSDNGPDQIEHKPGDMTDTKHPDKKKPHEDDEIESQGPELANVDKKKPVKVIPDVSDISDDLIRKEDAEPPNEPERDASDSGAIIPMDDIDVTKNQNKKKPDDEIEPDETVCIKTKRKYAKIFENKVCYLEVEKTKAYWVGKCQPVDDDSNKFPPNIIAYIKTKKKLHYFMNKKGEYCVRKDNSREQCKVWKNNIDVFGCNVKKAEDLPLQHRYLCENPVISAGTVHDGLIYIFRGGKQWKFDNRPKDDKPFGELINGGYKAKTNWTDIHFPGGAGSSKDGFIMVYKTKWSKWMRENKGSSDGDLRDITIGVKEEIDSEMENIRDMGALVLINTKRKTYLKIKGSNVCSLKIKNNIASWDGPCKPVSQEENNFPPDITAAIKAGEPSKTVWYFIRKEGKYCQRTDGNKESCKEWNDNPELFGCNSGPLNKELEPLCQNSQITAGGNVDSYIMVFKRGKYWVFNNKPQKGKPLGDLVSGNDVVHIKYPGMHLPGGVSHNGKSLVIVYSTKWSQWKPEGSDDSITDIIDTPISDKEAKEPEDLSYSGALINVDEKNGKYAKVSGKSVCYIKFKDNKVYWDGDCKPVDKDQNNFPPDIVAAVKTKKKIWYYFDKKGKHCVRVDGDVAECNKWADNSKAFGCEYDNSPEMEALCENTAIKAGGNVQHIIYVHRGGKYWQFDNQEQPNKPLGKLVAGNLKAKDKWPEIHMAGGQSYFESSMIMVYKVKWSIWPSKPSTENEASNQLLDQPILEKEVEEEGDTGHSGALINVDIKKSTFAKIKGKNVCKLQVTGNMSVWIGTCHPVEEDEEQFPPNIFAAIRARDKNWYYLNDQGTYCKREQFDRKMCTDWHKNSELFGCKNPKPSPELKALCDNPNINSGGNYPPYIYVFRGFKYWKFDDKGGQGKPFGDLVVGNRPASDEFDGIHLPGGVSFNKNAMIIVYNNTWSQWKPRGKDFSDRNKMRQNDNEINDAPIGTVEISKASDEPEPLDEPDAGHPDGGGGLFVLNEKIGRYAKISADEVCYYKITPERCTLIKNCEKVTKDKNNYPADVVAVIRDRRKNLIFFNGVGKYCQRSGKSKEKCSQWKSNAAIFGCDSPKAQSRPLSSLCAKPKISSGTNLSPFIYVFRGGKYWKFNNRPKPGLPIGECVEGGILAKDKWPGIRFPGGAGYKKSSLIMVFKKMWSIWSANETVIDKKIDSISEMTANEKKTFLKTIEDEDKNSEEDTSDESDSGGDKPPQERNPKKTSVKGPKKRHVKKKKKKKN